MKKKRKMFEKCFLQKNLVLTLEKLEKNGLTMFSLKKFKVLTLEKLEKNGLTMFSPKKLCVLIEK